MSPTTATTTVWPLGKGGGGGASFRGGPGGEGLVGDPPHPGPSSTAAVATRAAAREARPDTSRYNYRSAGLRPVDPRRHTFATRSLHQGAVATSLGDGAS